MTAAAHLFSVNVTRSPVSSLLTPPDTEYFVPNGVVLNDGSFALDAPTPIELDGSVDRVYVNFAQPVNLTKIYAQPASGMGWYTYIGYSFPYRAKPNIIDGSTFSQLSVSSNSGVNVTNVIKSMVETVSFGLTPVAGHDKYSVRFGFEVSNAVSAKLIANNGITRTFYQDDFTTIIPSWSPDFRLQLVSSAHTGAGNTTVRVKKVA